MSSNWFEVNLTEPNPEKCMIKVKNETILTDLYQGIPQTLVLNIIAWLLLIILFTILRHQAWDYGRLALVNSNGNKKRWTQIFYAHGNEDGGGVTTDNGSNGSSSGGGGGGNIGINGSGGSISTTTTTPITQNHHTHIDHGIFSWMLVTFKLKKDQILMHSGPDAVHYLSFQQHLMCVMGIITFISIVIILPINFHGNLSGDANSFGHTTLSNLDPNSSVLWVHVIISILYAPLVVLIMRRSSGRNAFKKAPIRTIMITNISPSDRNKMIIRNYMQELFPDVNIEDIQLAYNIKKLTETNEDYERVSDARQYCEEHRNRNLLRATPHWYNCKTVPAYDYYVKEEQRLAGEVARLRASALNEPLGIAFITVSTVLEAQNIILHFRPGTYRNWNLSFAPSPSDIFWENINVSASKWYLKYAIVNIILFLVLFFLTTPAIIVNALDTLTRIKGSIYRLSPLVSEFLPTLMLWILSALMPVIVAYSDKWLSHWTRSQQNYSIMTKSFGYLLFMILILPSLGLTSAQAFLEWTINRTESYRWECIFLPDKGAFFVNYVITSSFIGTILELIRFPELIVYMWFLCTAKSRAETSFIRRSILIEFPFGIHYAWTVLVFTMSTVYSVACPLIMPFAMVYICFKHFVDRHNLYFSYGPSNMISQNGGKIHSTAVTMTKFSIVILLTIMGAITAVRGQGIDAKSIVLIISLFLTLTLFTFMSPIKRCALKRPSITEVSGPAPIYIADVLFNNKPPRHSDSGNTINGYGSDTQRCASENEIHNNLNIDNSSDDIPVAI